MAYRLITPFPPRPPATRAPIIVNLGAGVDSTAILLWMLALGIRPDAIVFAWVGGEKSDEHPETLTHLSQLSAWLQGNDFPAITVVTYRNVQGRYSGLAENCLANATLPSAAFGKRKCSAKMKAQPIDQAISAWLPRRIEAGRMIDPLLALAASPCWNASSAVASVLVAAAALLNTHRIIRIIGFGWLEYTAQKVAAELDRTCRQKTTFAKPDKRIPAFRWIYPLQTWEMSREESEQLCRETLGYCPRPSSCTICVAMGEREIIALAWKHPELARVGVLIEQLAEPKMREKDRGLLGPSRRGRYSKKQERWLSTPRPGRWIDLLKQEGLMGRVKECGPTFDETGLPEFVPLGNGGTVPDFGRPVSIDSIDAWLRDRLAQNSITPTAQEQT